MYKSVKQINTAFRAYAKKNNISIKHGKPQNEQITDTRLEYCDFIGQLHDNGEISDYMLQNAHYY